MPLNSFDVIRIPTSGPGDVSGLVALISSGALEPQSTHVLHRRQHPHQLPADSVRRHTGYPLS